ncbi:ribonuclease III [Spirulina major]|uniref:ribonuclease III n=1 Tax=Spirulina major TaxID=270636 RepID=UPI000932D883|nr:ribonuclease III [Spirulina major]
MSTLTDPRREKQLHTLMQRFGLAADAPVDLQLLNLALTHPSIDRHANYEQLEFVGDAVVRLLASDILLETYPDAFVGEFAAIRSVLVSDRVLAELGLEYGLDRYLLMSGNRLASGRNSQQIRLADVFEAVLGAFYRSTMDMSLIRFWFEPILREKSAEVRADPAFCNYKDALQEWTQGKYKKLPDYRVQENQAPTPRQERFSAEVWLNEQCLGYGKGPSKKAAEQAAAKEAFLAVSQIS